MRLYFVGNISGKSRWLTHGMQARNCHRQHEPIQLISRSMVERELAERCRILPRHHLCVMYLEVPKKWLVRRSPNVWECQRDIPPERVLGELFVEE